MKDIWPIFENDYISVDAHMYWLLAHPTAVSLIFMQSQVLSKSALIIGLFWPSVQDAPFFMQNMFVYNWSVQLNLHETKLLFRYLSHHLTWHCLLIYVFPRFYQFLFVAIIKLFCTDMKIKTKTISWSCCTNPGKLSEIN